MNRFISKLNEKVETKSERGKKTFFPIVVRSPGLLKSAT